MMVKPKPRGVRVAPLNCQLIRQAADEIRKIFSIPSGHVDIVGLMNSASRRKAGTTTSVKTVRFRMMSWQ